MSGLIPRIMLGLRLSAVPMRIILTRVSRGASDARPSLSEKAMPLDNLAGWRLEARLRHEVRGEVQFDTFSRGRYATDASIYQIEPLGVVVPKSRADAAAAIAIAREEGVPVLPRGAGTSQCGQTVARALVVDCSKHMDRIVAVDIEGRRARCATAIWCTTSVGSTRCSPTVRMRGLARCPAISTTARCPSATASWSA